jgi:hypothetical protein
MFCLYSLQRTYLEVLEACSLDNTSYAVQFLKQGFTFTAIVNNTINYVFLVNLKIITLID